MKISKNNILKLSIFLSIICFFSLNIFSNNTFNRISLDTTQNSLYTISSGTKKFLKNIDEPIHLRPVSYTHLTLPTTMWV